MEWVCRTVEIMSSNDVEEFHKNFLNITEKRRRAPSSGGSNDQSEYDLKWSVNEG